MMNFFSISLVTVSWVIVGFSLAFGPDVGHGFIGNLHYALLMHMSGVWPGTHVPKLVFMAFQLMFAIITPALVSGAIAGRVKFGSWVAFVVAWSVLVYPVLAHWLFDPNGWLYRLGARDFAGGLVVHASAGTAAVIFVILLGPRIKKSRESYAPHSVPLVLLGAGILWFGWFGFNAGSALSSGQLAANALVATQLAAASAGILWALLERAVTGRVTVVGIATGGVVGLATITPASGFVGPMPALFIGALAGIVSFSAAQLLLRWKRFDDAFDVVACHGVGGAFGMLMVGVFADYRSNPAGLVRTNGVHINGLIFGHWALLGDQVIAVVVGVAFTAIMTFIILVAVRSANGLRVPEIEEMSDLGLNAYFDEIAYEPENVRMQELT
jgi:ammonium transporter